MAMTLRQIRDAIDAIANNSLDKNILDIVVDFRGELDRTFSQVLTCLEVGRVYMMGDTGMTNKVSITGHLEAN